MPKNVMNLDAQETVFLEQQLNQISDRIFDYKRPGLNARDAFPISYEGDPGAESMTFRQFDETGEAEFVSNYADDIPIADVVMEEYFVNIRMMANGFTYSIKEIKSASLANIDLESRRAMSSQKAIEQKLNKSAWHGDADFGIQGFFTAPNIPTGSATTGGWATATSQEMYDDVSDAHVAQIELTNGVFTANEIWLPSGSLAILGKVRMSDGTDTTVKKFLEDNLNITFKAYAELKGAGAGGTNRMVIVDKSVENFSLEIAEELQIQPMQEINLAYKIPMYLQTAGVAVHQPYSVSFVDGI